MKRIITGIAAAAALAGSGASAQIVSTAEGQAALIASPDPKLAANKKLVYDMYRAIVQGGHAEMVDKFFTPEYLQHNPNVASGRDALAELPGGQADPGAELGHVGAAQALAEHPGRAAGRVEAAGGQV